MEPFQVSPSMWRSRPFFFAICLLLVPVGIGLVLIGVWYLIYSRRRLTIDNRTVRFEDGVLSKRTSEVYIEDVRNVQIDQGLMDRMFGAGTVRIASAGLDTAEISISGVPEPERVQDQIEMRRNEAA